VIIKKEGITLVNLNLISFLQAKTTLLTGVLKKKTTKKTLNSEELRK